MSNMVVQTFLIVLVLGGFAIIFFLVFKNMFFPKKISALKNYLKNENYKSAVVLAKEIINKDKGNTEAHFYLGEAYYKQNKNELALIEYKLAEKSGLYSNISERELREKLAELYDKMDNIEDSLKEYILLSKQYSDNYFW